MRVAFSRMAWNTGSKSPGDELMTRNTCAVAVCFKQARVLDGDDGLFREIVHKLDLFVAERPHLLAVDGDRADQRILLEHRYDENGPSAGHLGQGNRRRLAFDVGLLRSEVGDVLQLLRRDNAAERIEGAKADYRVAPPQRVPFRWRTVHRDDAKRVAAVQ